MADQIIDIISKLGVDASEVYSEIDKVNAKYSQNTEALRKQKKELDDLIRFEAGLQAQRAKTNNPTIVAQFNKEIEKTRADIDKLNKSMAQTQTEVKGVGKAGTELKKGLGEAFDGTKAQSLRTQLRALKEELANTEVGTERFNELATEAGRVQDKIQDATQAAQAFSSESKAGTARTLFGQVVADIAQLDFKGAADKARQFAAVMSTITLKETLGGVKALGSALLQVGKTLITPPLGIVVAIAAAAYALYKLGVSMYEASLQSETLTDAIKEQGSAIREYADRYFEANLKIKEALKLIAPEEAANLRRQQQIQKDSLKLQEDYAKDILALAEELGLDLRKANKDFLFENVTLIDTERSQKLKFNEEKLKLDKLYLERAKAALKANAEEAKLDQTNINEELRKQREAEYKKRLEEQKAQAKKLRDLEISNISDEFAKQRATATAKYNDEFLLAKGNKELIAELRIQLDRELSEIDKAETKRYADEKRKQREIAEKSYIEQQERLAKEQSDREQSLMSRLDEQQRHETALLEIRTTGQKNQDYLLLANQIAFERARLDQYERFYGEESEQFIAQKNKLVELEERYVQKLNEADKKRQQEIIEQTKQIVDAVISSTEQIIASEEKRVDRLIALQQKRVDQVRDIADKGNAELLQLEQERLEKLTKEKEKYVRAQQALATTELIANTAVTISKAASQGGAAAAVTIAAALLALVAGLASARSIAGQAAFFKGGESDGYTGDGSIHDESNKVGRKPYIYHKKEFIFNNEKTSKYIDIFRKVHKGEVDLNKMKFESDMYKVLQANGISTQKEVSLRDYRGNNELSELKSSMANIVEAINSQERMKVVINDKGIAVIANKYIRNQQRINNIAR